jgi:hypothetical protein
VLLDHGVAHDDTSLKPDACTDLRSGTDDDVRADECGSGDEGKAGVGYDILPSKDKTTHGSISADYSNVRFVPN